MYKKNKMQRDAKDFIIHLQKQYRLLKKSKDEFDKGDTNGGAHVDRQLKEDYFTLKNQGRMGFEIARGGKLSNEPFPSPINLIISQITVEMLKSVKVELQRHHLS